MAGNRDPRASRTHWVVLVLAVLACFGLLVLASLTSGPLGEGARAPRSMSSGGTVPDRVQAGGPIVDPTMPSRPGRDVPDGHVVLTFDDGPTKWTARILDVLAAHDVKATFFVVGARAAERPDLIRRMRAEGHEVGVHGYTHVNLANVSPWRQRVELNQTQLSIAAASGYTTNLLRLPYSTTPDALKPSDWQALRRAVRYRAVLTDLDTRDWAKPGARRIVGKALPRGRDGAVITLHDGGGDRHQTVEALATLIQELQNRGYSFDTVTAAIGAPSPWRPATASQRVQGELVSGVVRTSNTLVDGLTILAILLVALAALRTLLVLILARRRAPTSPLSAPHVPPVSIVVPAFNEELGIGATVRSLAASRYPELEIIVVDGGSTDSTAAVVQAFELPNVSLVRQDNVGKAAALNAGVAAARHDVLVLVEADTVVEPHALRALVAPLAETEVVAVSGNTKVGNPQGLLGRWQQIEYVAGFNLDRRMFDVLRCVPRVPGAVSAYRRETLEALGGFSDETLAEDTDLTMAGTRAGSRVVYAPDARAWTEAPATLRELWRQRQRSSYGTLQAMWKHRAAVLERGPSGKLGRRGLPYLLAFQVLLPLLAPVIDVVAACSLLFLDSAEGVVLWLAFLALQCVSAVHAFRLDGEPAEPLWSLPLQQFVQRQLMCLVVIQSLASALYGIRLRRQALRRTGGLDAVPDGATVETRANASVNARVDAGVPESIDEPVGGSVKNRVNARI